MSQSINPSAPTVVLVHGTFADSSSWNAVTPSLLGQGYPVVAVAHPLRGLQSDTDYVPAVLKSVAGPIVRVGHSYAGSAIRNAPTRVANVVAPVFFPAAHPTPSRLHQRPSRRSGWKSTPVCFIYPELHKTIPAALHAFTAHRAGSKETVEVPGASHVLMLATGSCISTGGARHRRDSAHWRRVKSPNT